MVLCFAVADDIDKELEDDTDVVVAGNDVDVSEIDISEVSEYTALLSVDIPGCVVEIVVDGVTTIDEETRFKHINRPERLLHATDVNDTCCTLYDYMYPM